MSRTVKLINSNLGKVKTIETDAETWGELQGNSEVQSFMEGDVKAVVRQTQNTLESDRAELPEGDFDLFFITKKSKAGSGWMDEVRKNQEEIRDRLDTIESKLDNVCNYGGSVQSSDGTRPMTEDELSEAQALENELGE